MEFLAFVLNGLAIVVFIDAISTWFISEPRAFPRNLTAPITEPMYGPIRSILKPEMTGGLDFAPMILIFLFHTLARAVATSGLSL